MKNKISTAIIGVQKAATSSIYNYLLQHPDITGHDPSIEFSYFIRDEEFKLSWDNIWSDYFNSEEDSKLHLIKNAGIIFYEKALQRLFEHNQQIKLIIVLRNPIDRAYSGYLYAKKHGVELTSSFNEAIIKNKNNGTKNEINNLCYYLERGYYDVQLEKVYKYFSKDQVNIILYDDLILNNKKTVRDLFQFMAVDSSFIIDASKNYNKASKPKFPLLHNLVYSPSVIKELLKKIVPRHKGRILKRKILTSLSVDANHAPIDEQTKTLLLNHFKPHNDKLSKMLNKDLSFWNE